jgi:putative hydrolase
VPPEPSAGKQQAVDRLRRIAFLLERQNASTYRVQAFRSAASQVAATDAAALHALHVKGKLKELGGVGDRTAGIIGEALAGLTSPYLTELEKKAAVEDDARAGDEAASRLRSALRGDLHSHTEASDGGSPLTEMVLTAVELGHDYLAITDHSPRLTVANGLSPARLRGQLKQIAQVNEAVAPFRVLAGIEVDILDDGSLDQQPDLLERLDVVVASVHSKLRMDSAAMTRRMIKAVSNPVVTVLGHCTGRRVGGGRPRPPSEFDARRVFEACAEHGVAVEISGRPDRRDPPHALLQLAIDLGCTFSIDSDAHAPGQLDWQYNACVRAAQHDLDPKRIINTWPVEELLAPR